MDFDLSRRIAKMRIVIYIDLVLVCRCTLLYVISELIIEA